MKLKRVNAYLICEPHDMCEESYDVFVDDELAARLAVYAELLAVAKEFYESWYVNKGPCRGWSGGVLADQHGNPIKDIPSRYSDKRIEAFRAAIAKAEGGTV